MSPAIRRALDHTSQEPLTTGTLFAALVVADSHGRWERVLLAAGHPSTAQLRAADEDPDSRPVTLPGGLSGTLTLSSAFSRAEDLARRTGASAIDVGHLVWAFLTLPTAARDVMLTGGADLAELRQLVQEDLVGHDLPAAPSDI
jgi:hypothetical protein